jgi:hypothetical protein
LSNSGHWWILARDGAMKLRSGWTPANQIYCACLAQAGQLDEARAALARLKELHPAISVA